MNLAQANGAKIDAVKPVEGATGWSDTWMISSKAKNPNCMYMWMDHIISPQANAEVAEWFGEAPSNATQLRPDRRPGPLHDVPRRGRPSTGPTSGTGRPPPRSASTVAPTSPACPTPNGSMRGASCAADRLRIRPTTRRPPVLPREGRCAGWRASSRIIRVCSLTATLGAPVTWLLVVYVGSLLLLVVTAFFKLDRDHPEADE